MCAEEDDGIPERYQPEAIQSSGALDGFLPAAKLLDSYELDFDNMVASINDGYVVRRASSRVSYTSTLDRGVRGSNLPQEHVRHLCRLGMQCLSSINGPTLLSWVPVRACVRMARPKPGSFAQAISASHNQERCVKGEIHSCSARLAGLTWGRAHRRAVAKKEGKRDLVVKEIDCLYLDVEDRVRREASANKAVRGLKGCLPVIGIYAGINDPDDGGANYYFSMPCAPHPASDECLQALPLACKLRTYLPACIRAQL